MKYYGKLIRDCREASGLSITELSEISGIKENLIKNIEGNIASLSYDTALTLLEAMGYRLEVVKACEKIILL